MTEIGTPTHPLRVAVIGSGPSGFYATDALLNNALGLTIAVDMFERLVTPYGLVRGGVAPDHAKIKTVTKVYDKIAQHERFRYFGNVSFGKDVLHEDIAQHYHQVLYAVGASVSRELGIPGENLIGCYGAADFVAWYNGHPDYRDLQFDLSHHTVAVVGNGNVAMDVTRILTSTLDELSKTDIADYALEALRHSNVQRVVMLGRRGSAEVAFTHPELKEFGELEQAQVIVSLEEATPSEISLKYLTDKSKQKNVDMLKDYATRPRDPNKAKEIVMRFLVSPVEAHGTDRLERLTLVQNELIESADGQVRPRATDRTETLEVGTLFSSIGYKGVALPDVPFDERAGVFPNEHGRLLDAPKGQVVTGEYVAGWIKRGPSGIIGTNKPDSVETVKLMLEDAVAGQHCQPTYSDTEAMPALLSERGVRFVSFTEWQRVDAEEVRRGQTQGRPRVKFTDTATMLTLLEE